MTEALQLVTLTCAAAVLPALGAPPALARLARRFVLAALVAAVLVG